jgi:hypothetical protein
MCLDFQPQRNTLFAWRRTRDIYNEVRRLLWGECNVEILFRLIFRPKINFKAEQLGCLPFHLPSKTPERFVMLAKAKLQLGTPLKFQLHQSVTLEAHTESGYYPHDGLLRRDAV